MHDGLQEWMRPDPELDWRGVTARRDGVCDASKPQFLSGVELMKRISSNPQIRTFLLGHTHYNQLEVLQTGDELLPGKLPVGGSTSQMFATLEVQNPIRAHAFQQDNAGTRAADYDTALLPMAAVTVKNDRFIAMMDKGPADHPARARRADAGARP